MSMNCFFKAFSLDACNAMLKDHALIEQWVWNDDKSLFTTDVGTAWDVLGRILSDTGFSYNHRVEKVLSNGCHFISPRMAIEHHRQLRGWSSEKVRAALGALDPDEDLYHQHIFTDDEDSENELVSYFGQLSAFYSEAANRKLGVVCYFA